ncbi:putative inactive receptor kinase [Drosera capensis]
MIPPRIALIIILVIIVVNSSSVDSNAADEVRALLEFKKGITGDPLKKVLDSWNSTVLADESEANVCPSSFYGVVCDDELDSVTGIVLGGLGLSGELKLNTLVGLRNLRNLSLAGNAFSGRVVPALGTMFSIQYLDLSGNWFYGPIPRRLHDLYGLNYMNLSRNGFSGTYPGGLRNLQQLRVLDVSGNELWGDVGVLFSELANVEHVDVSENSFVGSLPRDPRNVSGLVNTLRYMNASGNKLNGGFFSEETVGLFRSLEVLDLGRNTMNGVLPSSIGGLMNLKVLRLGSNLLYGQIPVALFNGSMPLVELDLSGNGFSGSVSLINTTSLTTLNLSSNSLTGSLPSSVGQCSVVDLSGNKFSDDISVLQNWNSSLEVVDLSSNKLSGSLSNLPSQFSGLITLRISSNALVGGLPYDWAAFSQLRTVDLSVNSLDGPIPSSLLSVAGLVNLNLSRNQMAGEIPWPASHASELLSLSSFPPMESLDLSDNLLTGGLTSAIGNLGRLTLLNLANNSLSGQLPGELGKLNGLEFLDLSNNDFGGKIPGNLSSGLIVLNLTYNNLSGPIPKNVQHFPNSSFFPGNEFLQIGSGNGSSIRPTGFFPGRERHRSSKASIRVAIIVASVAAALMIAFVSLAYYRAQLHAFHGRSNFTSETAGRDVPLGRSARPSLFKFHKSDVPTQSSSQSFSNDHLLMSTSRSLSGPVEVVVEGGQTGSETIASTAPAVIPDLLDSPPLVTSARKSSSGSPFSSSPRFAEGSEPPVTLSVYSPDRLAGELSFFDSSLKFTAEELSRAPAEVLGRSSHGTLYKATLNSGQIFAVKWLRVGLVKSKKEFAREVKKVALMRHEKIVPLRAYYWGPREQERLILSDYVHGDSLALHLYETTPRRYSMLPFSQRLIVALDVARSLMFLHDGVLPHGDLKPTNIILASPDLSAHLTDYGLHRLMTPTGIAEQILNLGALGYCAPELAAAAKPVPSLKADVYAFGVILMELLTRRSAGDIISGQSGAVDLPDWVRLWDQEGRRRDCIDREILGGEDALRAMDDMLGISLRCILPVNERPTIRQVYEDLVSLSS